ncbi:MAG: hypothetical protein J07HQW1_03067 [Haloquadratum walsbyi J07HQW1]|uniref:Uncharacterized protein n=1 Tax=Haloquadratum walsbyi J07HQW1 TaxID=1238424 RepID=U1MS73_9EURY|nr:MAG: hypothetical protein J07HQW1_03067 [Haloquadratum walsbyi J07HQW1]
MATEDGTETTSPLDDAVVARLLCHFGVDSRGGSGRVGGVVTRYPTA